MAKQFISAWKDNDGNRFLCLAENHVHDTQAAAHQQQVADFIFYIPFGWATAGVVEIDLEDGKGQIPHVLCNGPMRSSLAVIEGPLFDEVFAKEAAA